MFSNSRNCRDPTLINTGDKMTETQSKTPSLGFDQIQEAASEICDHFGYKKDAKEPPIGLVLGSGLGEFAEHIKPVGPAAVLAYEDIPYFPRSTIVGHQGQLHFGRLGERQVIAMQGRVHLYEGYSAAEVVFPVRVLAALGVRSLVLTNAAGAINTSFAVGDLMLISDHINMTGSNPLLGPNDARLGNRFTDMTDAYSKSMRDLAREVAKNQNLTLREGCYFGVLGPSYETPAEIRMMRTCGADAVGMSTVFEAIAARHAGMNVLGISCLTNMAAGISGAALDHSDVTQTATLAGEKFTKLLFELIPRLA